MDNNNAPIAPDVVVDEGPSVDQVEAASRLGVDLNEQPEKPESQSIPEPSTPDTSSTEDKGEVKPDDAAEQETPPAEPPKRKYANTFETVEDLEKGYSESSREGIENRRKLKEGLNQAADAMRLQQLILNDPDLAPLVKAKLSNGQQPAGTPDKSAQPVIQKPEIKDPDVKAYVERLEQREAELHQEFDSRLAPIENERRENVRKQYVGELDQFDQEHPEFVALDEDAKGEVAGMAYKMTLAFPEDSLKKNMERAWREYDLDHVKAEAKKEAYAEMHTNTLSSIPSGGDKSTSPSSSKVVGLSDMDRKTAKMFGIPEDDYLKMRQEQNDD